jgi:phage-related protein
MIPFLSKRKADERCCGQRWQVEICVYNQRLVALHGFIKKRRATPNDDLMLARRRKKELEQ